jgi:hypothetical protein
MSRARVFKQLLDRHNKQFPQAAAYVLKKDAESYRRLA